MPIFVFCIETHFFWQTRKYYKKYAKNNHQNRIPKYLRYHDAGGLEDGYNERVQLEHASFGMGR